MDTWGRVGYFSLEKPYQSVQLLVQDIFKLIREDQSPTFGGHMPPPLQGVDATTLTNFLATELREHFDVFYLDQMDNLPKEKAKAFFEQLAKHVGTTKIVVNGRLAPRVLWQDFVDTGKAVCVGDILAPNGGIFAHPNDNRQRLVFRGFSHKGELWLNEELLPSELLPPQGWELLAYAMLHREFTSEDVYTAIWSHLEHNDARNVFHVTKSKINDVLGFDLLDYKDKIYRINNKVCVDWSDVERFTTLVREAKTHRGFEDTSEMLLWAVELCHQVAFLSEVESPWIAHERSELQKAYLVALRRLASLYRHEHDLERALHYYLQHLAIDFAEGVVVPLMELYSQLRLPEKAYDLYTELESRQEPQPATTSLRRLISQRR